RHDPQPEIYQLYEQCIRALCARVDVAACLRGFELEFLGLLGYAVNLDREAGTHHDIDPDRNYDYRVEDGPVPVERPDGPLVFSGATLLAIAAGQFDDKDVLRAANRLLRDVIGHHLGGKELQSRKVLLEVRRGRIAPHEKPDNDT
ncbi:MAG: DNA repair protein RecO C-terminal domain-containing protein, partial [Gammaproteobacteria bacterium]|nr:DNA repair protein RecO C-terminal domain-containing protein [Gammaproteobacteria bacterium]